MFTLDEGGVFFFFFLKFRFLLSRIGPRMKHSCMRSLLVECAVCVQMA
jgi:hypothetical protein